MMLKILKTVNIFINSNILNIFINLIKKNKNEF